MPLDEEGAKWSCEPCIRGHRSSKCQHFDRLMMKVPKAGRPLAKCPHPKGSCSCERVYAFMVRIPKGSTCLCRPLYQVPAGSTETPSVPASSATTPSIASTPVATGRVQKHSRRPSAFQSPSDNFIKALDSEIVQSDSKKDIQLLRQPTGLDAEEYNAVSGRDLESIDNSAAIHNNAQNLARNSVSEAKPGGCCGGKLEPVAPPPQQRSCCGGPPALEEAKGPNTVLAENAFKSTWPGLNTSESIPWDSQFYNNNYTPQNNTYPQKSPPYRNESQPSQPATNTNYPGNMGPSSMDQLLFNPSTYPFNVPLPFVNDSNHDCSCGDTCQCLGCASHPFNETTRQHVQEMGYMMTVKEEDDKSNASSPFAGTKSPPTQISNVPSNHNQTIPSHTARSFTDDPTLLPSFDNNPLASPTFASDQFMQPSEYYTLEYPVGFNVCSDITGTCQCGNDCSCVGCITHSGHDGITLESMSAENQRAAAPNEDMTQDFREYISQTSTDVPRSMDQYSPSALSPPVVETPLG